METNDATPPSARPLPVLRAMIDAVDRDILALLARRNAIVSEVAEWKRHNGVGIRDHRRERELIADRRDRAVPLGVSADVTESIFRLVLWASRDRQAALKAEVPVDEPPRTVAVIGGAGGMGGWMARLFGDLGHAVMIADLETDLRPEAAAEVADVVVISVPIDVTESVIRDLAPRVREDALLMDVTSIKAAPMAAMLESSSASVVGTHPLFGPSVHTAQGQRIALTPGRGDAWCAWLERMLAARGLLVIQTTPDEHDRAMSVVQVLTHFSTEAMGRALAAIGHPIGDTLRFTSPVYLMELLMTARHFAQSPDLYASIQMSNPARGEVTSAYAAAVNELADIVDRGDHDAMTALFEDVRAYLGDFTERALEESSYMIDRIVERG